MRQHTTCKEAVTSVIVRLCRLREDKKKKKNIPKKICVTLFNTRNQAVMEEKKKAKRQHNLFCGLLLPNRLLLYSL